MNRTAPSILLEAFAVCFIATVMLGLVFTPSCARGTTLDDYIAAGFSIIRATAPPGQFRGCKPSMVIILEDGSRFRCMRRIMANSYHPKAYILRDDADMSYVMLIGNTVFPGALLQSGTYIYKTPRSLNGEPPPESVKTDDPFASGLSRVEPIQSLNELEAAEKRRLNDAQASLPVRSAEDVRLDSSH